MDIKSLSTEQLVHIWKVWYKKDMTKEQDKMFKQVCNEYKFRTGNSFPKKGGKPTKK